MNRPQPQCYPIIFVAPFSCMNMLAAWAVHSRRCAFSPFQCSLKVTCDATPTTHHHSNTFQHETDCAARQPVLTASPGKRAATLTRSAVSMAVWPSLRLGRHRKPRVVLLVLGYGLGLAPVCRRTGTGPTQYCWVMCY